MTVVFISNYFNHHQKPFADSMYSLLGEDWAFIETDTMDEERIKLGWKNEATSYVKRIYTSERDREECQNLIDSADVVIIGSAPDELVRRRIKSGKLLFRYSERPLKKGMQIHKYLPRFVQWQIKNPFWKPIYMLCASAYTASDYKKFGMFIGKSYKWGYFPEIKSYSDIDALIDSKQKNSLLWVARLIDWKHPEAPIEIAKRLKKDGYDFSLNVIGNGELEDNIKSKIHENGLEDQVHMLGGMPPEKVREYMEKSEIFLFTSDRQEGWGAVLNESMNSGCAVVGSHAIGSVPFLLKDGENGLVYKDGDLDELYSKTKWLIDDQYKRKEFGKRAYYTMTEQWNAKNAAERFLALSQAILDGNSCPNLFESGVCSKE